MIPTLVAAKSAAPHSRLERGDTVVLFATAAHLAGNGARWVIPVHGWVYVAQLSRVRKAGIAALLSRSYGLRGTPQSQPLFDRRVDLLLADNKSGRRLVVEVAGQRFTMPPTRANGHFRGEITLPEATAAKAADGGLLKLRVMLADGDPRAFSGTVHLLPPQGLSVISDIDDTVKITHVGDRKRLWDATLFQPFAAVPGMAEAYTGLARAGASFHFVSSSPWHLYDPLVQFLNEAGFPAATLTLKTIRLKDRSLLNLFKPGLATKPPQIEAILARYPQRTFVLIGDSGEQDPEVYAGLLRRHPGRIVRILIRNVTGGQADDARFAAVFAGIDRALWQLFDRPEEIRWP